MGLIHGILSKMFPPLPEPIGELRVGALATVRGVVVPRDLMDSPLTRERCVYYRYVIEQWRQSRVVGVGGDGFWEMVEQDEAILEFYVEDASGRAIVAPANALVSPGRRLAEVEMDMALGRRGRQLLIEPGDLIEVTAEAALAHDLFDEGRSYRSAPGRLLLCAPGSGRVTIRLVDKRSNI